MKNLVLFASGRGSNAEKIIQHFKDDDRVKITAIISNRKDAGVLALALKHKIPSRVISKKAFFNSQHILEYLKGTDLIVLAGFLWLIPQYLVDAYPQKIVNIHPSLLPRFGGKGMYGHHVHEAVKAANARKSGITIHYVNEEFDKGTHIFQESVSIKKSWSTDEIAEAVLALEHKFFPKVIAEVLFPK